MSQKYSVYLKTVYLKVYGYLVLCQNVTKSVSHVVKVQCISNIRAVEPSCYSRSILHQNPIFPESFQLATSSFSIFASIFEVLQYFKTTLRKDEIYIFFKKISVIP